jgi:L-2-hydroxyglutarate oxidase
VAEPNTYHVCVIGAGLVGLAVSRALTKQFEGITILMLEKEHQVATHQSGRNSGVVHSGLYYRPGTLKARLCVEGRDQIHQICDAYGIPLNRSGKLVVATDPSDLEALDELERRGLANGLTKMERIGPVGISDVEPHATGIEALHVPETSVVDFPAIARHIAARLAESGTVIETQRRVTAIELRDGGVTVHSGESRYTARVLINCAGLHSDRVARLAGLAPKTHIIPFRGEYYRLRASSEHLVRGLIYPVPDPRFPFLGVHFTRNIDGTVEVGPNAVLAFGRENYRDTPMHWPDIREMVSEEALRKLAAKYWRSGAREMFQSRSRHLYARQARELLPPLLASDLSTGRSGIRAQAVGSDGTLVDDFLIESLGPSIHVLNAPSPGATASLAIGQHVVRTAKLSFL